MHCPVLRNQTGKCILRHLLAWTVYQSTTETNCSPSTRTIKPPFPWIRVSRLISSEIFWSVEGLHSHCSLSVATLTRPLSHTQLLIFTKSVKTSCLWHLYLSVRFDRIWPTGSQLLGGGRINTACFSKSNFCREPALNARILQAYQQSKCSVGCCCPISQAGNAEMLTVVSLTSLKSKYTRSGRWATTNSVYCSSWQRGFPVRFSVRKFLNLLR